MPLRKKVKEGTVERADRALIFNTGEVPKSEIIGDQIKDIEDSDIILAAKYNKNIYLGYFGTEPTVKLGIIRGHDSGLSNAAMNTFGSSNGSYCITFETRDSNAPSAIERMRVDGNGNVGVGTSNPKELLQIGDKIAFHNGGWKGLSFNGYYVDTVGWKLLEYGYLGLSMWDTDYGAFRVYTGPLAGKDAITQIEERLTILNNGNVGIGTTNPSAKLEVNGDIKVTGDITVNNGNVGIGTTNPSAKLEVNGDIKVTGDITVKGGDIFLTDGADCAEDFDIVDAESIEPGTVMVIDNDGTLRASEYPYDKRAAGVISGAGDLRPGITLDRQKERSNRLPLALNGKVYCKVDAEYKPVEVGDLLTTSSTIGHAMKADDREKAFGAVIGKALRPIESGKGLIPILIALQ